MQSTDYMHKCSCGAAYTSKAWIRLEYAGTQRIPKCDEGPAYKLDMRNCPVCRSTMYEETERFDEAKGAWVLVGPMADEFARMDQIIRRSALGLLTLDAELRMRCM